MEISDEEEDDWEREVDHSPKKSRIAYETHLAVLDKNNNELRKTKIELEKELIKLEKELTQHEEEEEELLSNVKKLKNNNEALTIELAKLQRQERLEKNDYFEKDMKLTGTLEHILDRWQEILSKDDTVDDEEIELEGLIDVYKTTEFDIIDHTAQIEGYQERIRALNEYANNLPKEAPTLDETKLSIKECKDEIDAANTLLEGMEKEIIQPSLADLANCKINYPQKHLQEKLDIQLMENIIQDLDLVYNVAFKQRVQQQLMQYLFDEQEINEL